MSPSIVTGNFVISKNDSGEPDSSGTPTAVLSISPTTPIQMNSESLSSSQVAFEKRGSSEAAVACFSWKGRMQSSEQRIYTPKKSNRFSSLRKVAAVPEDRTSETDVELSGSTPKPSSELSDTNTEYPSTIRLIFIMFAIACTTVLASIDRTIITAAIPQITDDFHALSDVSWYGAAYLLTATMFQPIWGKAYQIFGAKNVFLFVVLLFMIGSLVCAASLNSKIFIVGRAVAGIGCAGVVSGSVIIVSSAVSLERRSTYVGVLMSMFGTAMFLGPIIGGVFTDKVSWRWCFYLNLPIGALSLVMIYFGLRNPAHVATKKTIIELLNEFDYVGPVLFIPANVCLLLALYWGGSEYAWNSPIIIGLFGGFGVLLPGWIYSQFLLGEKATIPFRLFRERTILWSTVCSFFSNASFLILLFYLPLYFQAVKGSTATESALDTVPILLSFSLLAIMSGVAVQIVGYYTPFIIVGNGILAVGTGLLSTLGVNTSPAKWIGYQIIAGFGTGLGSYMGALAIQAVVSQHDLPVATSVLLFSQSLGATVFLVVAQTVFLNEFLPHMKAVNQNITAKEVIQAGAIGLKALVNESQLPAVLEEYAKSLGAVSIIAAALAAVATVMACPLEWKRIQKRKVELEKESRDDKAYTLRIGENTK